MTAKDTSSAIITPNLGSAKPLTVGSFRELLSVVDRLGHDHARYVDATSHRWGEEFAEVAEIGFSFSVERSDGAIALVGVCQRGWKLHRIAPLPIHTVPGTQMGDDVVAILTPEWTEFEEAELLSRQGALEILRSWLEDHAGPLEE